MKLSNLPSKISEIVDAIDSNVIYTQADAKQDLLALFDKEKRKVKLEITKKILKDFKDLTIGKPYIVLDTWRILSNKYEYITHFLENMRRRVLREKSPYDENGNLIPQRSQLAKAMKGNK